MWKAHDSAIVSVEYAKHETGDYVITASTDKTARLWTLQDGQYIGTFGQVDKQQGFMKEPNCSLDQFESICSQQNE